MSGETLEAYFRRLYLDESRREYLENIKEGKHVDKEIEKCRTTFDDCRTQVFYVYEEICDSSSPELSAPSLDIRRQNQLDTLLHGGTNHHSSIFMTAI